MPHATEPIYASVDIDRLAALDIHNSRTKQYTSRCLITYSDTDECCTERLDVLVSPLELDTELTCHAQKRAHALAAGNDGCLPPQLSESDEGDNVVLVKAEKRRPMSLASELWAKERVVWYDGDRFRRDGGHQYGHYTQVSLVQSRATRQGTDWYDDGQMVWDKTTHMGIAAARAKSGDVYVVARYKPAGNREGEKPYPDRGLEDSRKAGRPSSVLERLSPCGMQ